MICGVLPLRPSHSNISKRMEWGTESKASFKSNQTTVRSFLSPYESCKMEERRKVCSGSRPLGGSLLVWGDDFGFHSPDAQIFGNDSCIYFVLYFVNTLLEAYGSPVGNDGWVVSLVHVQENDFTSPPLHKKSAHSSVDLKDVFPGDPLPGPAVSIPNMGVCLGLVWNCPNVWVS